MENVTRIGVSLEPDLLSEFDSLVESKGYTTRSEAIRDLIRNALVEEQWTNSEADVVGTITLVYDHHKCNVREKLIEIQHAHHSNISSTIHIHLSMEQCLEVLVVWGKVREVKHLADAVISVKGVAFGKLTMASGSQSFCDQEHEHPHEHQH
jgi:CopG family transcriptional regulator, nickel-responsive regulator